VCLRPNQDLGIGQEWQPLVVPRPRPPKQLGPRGLSLLDVYRTWNVPWKGEKEAIDTASHLSRLRAEDSVVTTVRFAS
jgi:hypothetical protein